MDEADDMRRGTLFAGQAGGLSSHRARAQMAENERRQAYADALARVATPPQFMGSVLEVTEPPPAPTWQPMHTAPRGRDAVILMCCFTIQGMAPILASFYTRQLGAEPAWHGYSSHMQHMIVRRDEVYWKWMPLPPPPAFVPPETARAEPQPSPEPAPFPRRSSRRMLG